MTKSRRSSRFALVSEKFSMPKEKRKKEKEKKRGIRSRGINNSGLIIAATRSEDKGGKIRYQFSPKGAHSVIMLAKVRWRNKVDTSYWDFVFLR